MVNMLWMGGDGVGEMWDGSTEREIKLKRERKEKTPLCYFFPFRPHA